MRLKVFTSLFTLFLACNLLFPDEYCKIEEMNLLPVGFYVGDNVELRLLVSVPPGRELTQPAYIPDLKWIDINKNIRIEDKNNNMYELRILFTSFIPGSHILSNIRIGDFIIPDVKIDTKSILEEKNVSSLAPYEDQVQLPGTFLILSLMVFFILFMPYIFIIAGKQFLKIYKQIQENRKRDLPANKIKKGLKKIKRSIKKMSPLAFYTKITVLLREYLNNRLKLPVLTATTRELDRLLFEHLDKKRYAEKIISIFRRGDLIKFAGDKGKRGELSSTLDTIFGIVDSVEESDHGV